MKTYFWLDGKIKIIYGFVTIGEIKNHKLVGKTCLYDVNEFGSYEYVNSGTGYQLKSMSKDLVDPLFLIQLMLLGIQ